MCNLNLIFTEEKLLGSFDVCFNQGTRTGKGSKTEDERSGWHHQLDGRESE